MLLSLPDSRRSQVAGRNSRRRSHDGRCERRRRNVHDGRPCTPGYGLRARVASPQTPAPRTWDNDSARARQPAAAQKAGGEAAPRDPHRLPARKLARGRRATPRVPQKSPRTVTHYNTYTISRPRGPYTCANRRHKLPVAAEARLALTLRASRGRTSERGARPSSSPTCSALPAPVRWWASTA